MGAGQVEGSLDAANLLKPSLARGELRLIGATTGEEFRQHIERDGALHRRFQVNRMWLFSCSTVAVFMLTVAVFVVDCGCFHVDCGCFHVWLWLFSCLTRL